MNAADERAVFLRERLRGEGLLTAEVAARLEVPWRYHRLVAYCVFFLLTAAGVGAFYGLCHAFDATYPGVITAVFAIVLAEYLIGARRWFHTGVEAALWLGALFAAVNDLPSSGEPEAILVLAAVFAVAGARVRNPLFGAAATVCVAYYFEERFDLGVVAAIAIAILAMLALLRTWRRPTTEWLFIATALVLPIAGWFMADEIWRTVTIILYTGFAVVAFTLGLTRRHHAYFFAAMIGASIAAIDIGRTVTFLRLEARLALGGAALLAATFALSRLLRDKTEGFVTTPRRNPADSLTLLGTVATQPAADASPDSDTLGGGGQFGGAGASGNY